MSVVVLNTGSSSVKFAIYDAPGEAAGGQDLRPVLRGQVDGIATSHARIKADGAVTPAFQEPLPEAATGDVRAALDHVVALLKAHPTGESPVAVGHRVVHGGRNFSGPARVDTATLAALEQFTALAPQHQPFNLAGVRASAATWPEAVQVASFDTAFHRTQSALVQRFALPRRYEEAGVIRYGFHGLSYDYIAHVAPDIIGAAARGRMVVAHLGNGVSLCAMHAGRSVATTMGFTALEGMPMGTRCGALDPGVVLHMLEDEGLSAREVAAVLYKQSGLLGLSGLSGDMRTLEASDTPEAQDAIAYFELHCARAIASLAADLGGLDALVFTAGIGEHSARVRAGVIARLGWLGFALDGPANETHGPRITRADATAPQAYVIPTNEELMIARQALQVAAS